MTTEELLLELRDIQQPVEPGWWLLAPVWVIMLGLLFGLVLLAWLILRHRRNNRLLVEAKQEFDVIRQHYHRHRCGQNTLQALSAWLRQVAMAAYPDQQIAAMTGPAWTRYYTGPNQVPFLIIREGNYASSTG